MFEKRPTPSLARCSAIPILALLTLFLWAPFAAAQGFPDDEPVDEPVDEPDEPGFPPRSFSSTSAQNQFRGSMQVVRGPGGSSSAASAMEIFPDAAKVWLSIRDVDPVPIETARRGGKWVCSGGQCTAATNDQGQSSVGDKILRSIKLQTSALPLPLTIWGRMSDTDRGTLFFDPVLIGRRSYEHIGNYPPIAEDTTKAGAPAKKPGRVDVVPDQKAKPNPPDTGELTLNMQWPTEGDLANFRYLAIVDSCGNARVQSFQRTFVVPVFLVAQSGCGTPDGKVLRIFPTGGSIRVTAFNLDEPAGGNVINATYRVSIPPLENLVESSPARLLFPDPSQEDLKVDCGPNLRTARTGSAIPVPPGAAPPGAVPPGAVPPGAVPPGAVPPGASSARPSAPPAGSGAPAAPPTGSGAPAAGPPPKPPAQAPPAGPPPGAIAPVAAPAPPPVEDPSKPQAQPLAHQGLVIAPEPLRLGNCRVSLLGQTKRRLVAPLALHVSLARTDKTRDGAPIELLTDGTWIVTPSNAEFTIPALSDNFDGDSRLKLAVYSDPLSDNGKVVLLSDAARVAIALKAPDAGEPERARRMIGSVTIHSVPLCGEGNFQTVESVGRCLRAYVTVPAMLATLQVTRAPWVEKPIITRSVLGAVGVALAIDAYDPVQRKAFPIAGQVGGFVQSLGDGRVGLLGYVGIAPTIPVLGEGGNTTSVGLLGGIGVEYITNETGPDEGLKPAAFVSLVVQVGQASANAAFRGSASVGE